MLPLFTENAAFTERKRMNPTMKRIKIRIAIAFTASWRRQSAPAIFPIYAAILDRPIGNAKPGVCDLRKV
jgi:hypothetical protein